MPRITAIAAGGRRCQRAVRSSSHGGSIQYTSGPPQAGTVRRCGRRAAGAKACRPQPTRVGGAHRREPDDDRARRARRRVRHAASAERHPHDGRPALRRARRVRRRDPHHAPGRGAGPGRAAVSGAPGPVGAVAGVWTHPTMANPAPAGAAVELSASASPRPRPQADRHPALPPGSRGRGGHASPRPRGARVALPSAGQTARDDRLHLPGRMRSGVRSGLPVSVRADRLARQRSENGHRDARGGGSDARSRGGRG